MFQVLVWSKARIKPSPLKPSFSQFRKCLRHKIANLFILSRLAFKMFMNALLFQLNFYYELKMEIAFFGPNYKRISATDCDVPRVDKRTLTTVFHFIYWAASRSRSSNKSALNRVKWWWLSCLAIIIQFYSICSQQLEMMIHILFKINCTIATIEEKHKI